MFLCQAEPPQRVEPIKILLTYSDIAGSAISQKLVLLEVGACTNTIWTCTNTFSSNK